MIKVRSQFSFVPEVILLICLVFTACQGGVGSQKGALSNLDEATIDTQEFSKLDSYLQKFGYNLSPLRFSNWFKGMRFRYPDVVSENADPDHFKILRVFVESESFREHMFSKSVSPAAASEMDKVVYGQLIDVLSKLPSSRRLNSKSSYFPFRPSKLFDRKDVAINSKTFTVGSTDLDWAAKEAGDLMRLDPGYMRDQAVKDLSIFSSGKPTEMVVMLPNTTFVPTRVRTDEKSGIRWVFAQVVDQFDCNPY